MSCTSPIRRNSPSVRRSPSHTRARSSGTPSSPTRRCGRSCTSTSRTPSWSSSVSSSRSRWDSSDGSRRWASDTARCWPTRARGSRRRPRPEPEAAQRSSDVTTAFASVFWPGASGDGQYLLDVVQGLHTGDCRLCALDPEMVMEKLLVRVVVFMETLRGENERYDGHFGLELHSHEGDEDGLGHELMPIDTTVDDEPSRDDG